MTCPGLHCPGCSGGRSLAILGGSAVLLVLAASAAEWVAARIWWIGGTLAVAYALSLVASAWLARRCDRRGREWGHAHGIYSRADAVLPPPARVPVAVPERQAILPPRVTVNFYGVRPSEAAAVIRQIPGTAGDAGTEED